MYKKWFLRSQNDHMHCFAFDIYISIEFSFWYTMFKTIYILIWVRRKTTEKQNLFIFDIQYTRNCPVIILTDFKALLKFTLTEISDIDYIISETKGKFRIMSIFFSRNLTQTFVIIFCYYVLQISKYIPYEKLVTS